MSVPLRWAPGDRCAVKGRVGTVVKLLPKDCAWVVFDDEKRFDVCCFLEDLDLVPFAAGDAPGAA